MSRYFILKGLQFHYLRLPEGHLRHQHSWTTAPTRSIFLNLWYRIISRPSKKLRYILTDERSRKQQQILPKWRCCNRKCRNTVHLRNPQIYFISATCMTVFSKECFADLFSSQGISGYISVMATLEFTDFFKLKE